MGVELPFSAEQFGNPMAATALGSLEPEVPAVALQGHRTGAEICCSIPAEAAARRALQSLTWALVEMGGEGWAPTVLQILSPSGLPAVPFYQDILLNKSCQLLNLIQHSGESHTSLMNH